jgi:CubicO group peptidase (beta-lactamase class C family)
VGKTEISFFQNPVLFLFKPSVLKNHLASALLLLVFIACNVATAEKKKPAKEDSLQYYPPTPTVLSQQEFRHYYRELNGFFDSMLIRRGFNGGILVAKNGSVIYEKYVGFRDLRKKDSLTDTTALHIASSGKTFTAIAILRLIQENKLSLNDTISKFFPNFPYAGITVKMLLSHRSGLPNYVYFIYNSGWDTKKFATNQDMLNILYTNKPNPNFPPNKRFSYSNTNFVLLAMIVEKLTGKTFPEFMKEKFFDPLQMKHTYIFTLKDTLTSTPSFTAGGAYWDFDFLDGTYGDKNLYTTPQDLLKWDQALYTDQIISKALLDSAFTPYSLERPSVHNYGLGWRLQILPNGKKIIYHFGKWHGFNAAFARLTDEKVTIIILGNKFNRNIYNAAHLCYDFFGEYLQRHTDPEDENDNPEATKKITGSHAKKKNTSSKSRPLTKTRR